MNRLFVACTVLASLVSSVPVAAESLLERGGYRPLVADQRAFRPGDNLTVLITESATSLTTASTSTNKEGAVAASVSASREGGGNPSSRTLGVGLEAAEDFKGGGRIERTGKLLARLTVVVEAVEPNGMLLVRGEQEILVNEERQRIALEGRVRPLDIGPENTVLSTRLSQARIELTGQGLLAEKQKPGVLTRFLSWLGIL